MKFKRISKIVLWVLAAVLCAALSIRFLSPFLIAMLIALAVQRPIGFLQKKAGLSRGAASFFCVFIMMAALAAAIYFLCRLLCTQVIDLIEKMPSFAASLATPIANFEQKLYAIAAELPDGLGTGLKAGIESLFKSGSLIGKKVYEWLFGAASGFIRKLPSVLFAIFTAILGAFLLSAELPEIAAKIKEKLPQDKKQQIIHFVRHLRDTLGHWVKAELKISAIMTVIITIGLSVLSVPYAVLFGLFAGIVDALPIFGAGAVLVPWAVILLLRSEIKKAIGMMLLYVICSITRQVLEPKLVGKQMGISPLVMLAAIYVGFRLFGVYGMVLFPIGVVITKSFVGQNRL